MNLYRHEVASGSFYKSSSSGLRTQIKDCFLNKTFGPGGLPSSVKTNEFKAFIVPHAGYSYSGCCAAHAFKRVGENTKPEVIVILGVDHSGGDGVGVLFPNGSWLTPLGEVRVSEEFNDLLINEGGGVFASDEFRHSDEHSIEVQLPFIKYLYPDNTPLIVPILVNASSTDVVSELGSGLFKAWRRSGKRVLFLASSDLTHAGVRYGFSPFPELSDESFHERVKSLDGEFLELVCDLNESSGLEFAKSNGLTICGLSPILVLINVLNRMKGKNVRGEVLSHYTSGEVVKNYTNFVDYASVEFKQVN